MCRKFISILGLCAVVFWASSAVADGDWASLGVDSEADNANVGSGSQTNANDWDDMLDVNLGGNQLTGGGINSNGGDRESSDVVIIAGDTAEVSSYTLDASVTDNSVSVAGSGSSADSKIEFSHNSGYTNNYGVTAVSLNAGAGANQSVSVNVNAAVDLGSAL